MNRAVIGAGVMLAAVVISGVLGLVGAAPGLLMASLLCFWPGLLFVLGRLSTQYTFKRLDNQAAPVSISRRPRPQQFESLS